MNGVLIKHHRSVHALFDSTCDQEYGHVKFMYTLKEDKISHLILAKK